MRGSKSLFKHSKQGIVYKHPREYINLTELFKIDPVMVYDILDNLLEQDYPEWIRDDIKDVIEEFVSKGE